jgi:hypothetical protein
MCAYALEMFVVASLFSVQSNLVSCGFSSHSRIATVLRITRLVGELHDAFFFSSFKHTFSIIEYWRQAGMIQPNLVAYLLRTPRHGANPDVQGSAWNLLIKIRDAA